MAIRRFVDGKVVRCDDTVVFRKRKGDEREREEVMSIKARKQGEERQGERESWAWRKGEAGGK
jgi:hypothetical protein